MVEQETKMAGAEHGKRKQLNNYNYTVLILLYVCPYMPICVSSYSKYVLIQASASSCATSVAELLSMLTYAGVCWRMLTYADVC
jgi:hypothetical protein